MRTTAAWTSRIPAVGADAGARGTEQYLAVLDGFPAKFPPGERFSYCNSGYVVLALIAERARGVPYHDLVRARVCEPAGMRDTEFLRSDELPDRPPLATCRPRAAGGAAMCSTCRCAAWATAAYTTRGRLSNFWRLCSPEDRSAKWVAEMVRAHTTSAGGTDALRGRFFSTSGATRGC